MCSLKLIKVHLLVSDLHIHHKHVCILSSDNGTHSEKCYWRASYRNKENRINHSWQLTIFTKGYPSPLTPTPVNKSNP